MNSKVQHQKRQHQQQQLQQERQQERQQEEQREQQREKMLEQQERKTVNGSKRLSRILFGSCNSQNLTQPLWAVAESRDAAAFVWGGDAIYADIYEGIDTSGFPPRPIFSDATPERLRSFYRRQLDNPGYASFLSRKAGKMTVFGTIDDHDMGANNGDNTFSHRREAGLAFVEFTGERAESPIYKRASQGHGVYGVKMFDFDRPRGMELLSDEEAGIDPEVLIHTRKNETYDSFSNKTVAVFVLDCRTQKTAWPTKKRRGQQEGRGEMNASGKGDFLGERQWKWFETAIRNSRASVNVIVNGLQIHPEPRTSDPNLAEGWGQFPDARDRLYRAVLLSGVRAPMFISGDVHMAQLMRKDCHPVISSSVRVNNGSRPLIELTTSGMTHSWGTCASPQMRHHTKWYSFYSYFASRTLMSIFHRICPWTDLVVSSYRSEDSVDISGRPVLCENGGCEGAKRGKQFALDLNFGELEFDWDERVVIARVLGRDNMSPTSPPLLSASWSMEQLSGRAVMPGGEEAKRDIASIRLKVDRTTMKEQPLNWAAEEEWICVNHRGTPNAFHSALSHAIGWGAFCVLLTAPLTVVCLGVFLLRRRTYARIPGLALKTKLRTKQKQF